MADSNHPGKVMIAVSPELAAFVLENCETNLEFGLRALDTLTSRDLLEKLVANMERFKELRAATKEALDG